MFGFVRDINDVVGDGGGAEALGAGVPAHDSGSAAAARQRQSRMSFTEPPYSGFEPRGTPLPTAAAGGILPFAFRSSPQSGAGRERTARRPGSPRLRRKASGTGP